MRRTDEWVGWPPYELWSSAEHAASLIGWLDRRVSTTNNIVTIFGYTRTFETMWTQQFGLDTPIPAAVKERVNAKIRLIREASHANH
jgi:hypothetical protein